MSNILKIKSFKLKAMFNFIIFSLSILLSIFICIINIENLNAEQALFSSSEAKSVNFGDCNFFNQPKPTGRYRRSAPTQPSPSTQDDKLPENNEHNASMIVDYVADVIAELLPEKYNKNLRPNFGGVPTLVRISLRIYGISSISETDMEYKVDFVVRHYWNDPRLTFDSQYNISVLSLGEEFAKQIWLPDTFIQNGRETETQKTVPGPESTLLRIGHDGEILYSTRVVLTANCPMDLTYFPMDQQKCSIVITSYGLPDHDLTFAWGDNRVPIEISSDINLPTFRLVGYNRRKHVHIVATGNYTLLIFEMFLARSIGFYVMQIYIPAFLVVVISWVPFWLDRDDHHARVALGVTTILTITTLITNTNTDFPKISHLKAIDIYLFASFLMVFASLFEYAMVGYYEFLRTLGGSEDDNSDKDGRQNRKKRSIQMEPQQAPELPSDSNPDDAYIVQTKRKLPFTLHKMVSDTSLIDNWSRWAFPTAFVVFNFMYAMVLWGLAVLNDADTQYEVKLN